MKRKIFSLLLVVFTLFCAVACNNKNNTGRVCCEIVANEETRLVFTVTEKDGNFTVLDCMENLSADGAISYEMSGGMVTEINGKKNAANAYWMLYTSDAEMSNTEWGAVEYEGKTFSSAILGAEALIVVVGETYIWEYVNF